MNDIVITSEMIEEWKEEKARLEGVIKESQTKLDLINRRLEALRLFSEGSDKAEREALEADVANLSAPAAILLALTTSSKPMSTIEIRNTLAHFGYPEERWGKNHAYFYTAIKRLADSRKVHRDGKKYFLPTPAIEGQHEIALD